MSPEQSSAQQFNEARQSFPIVAFHYSHCHYKCATARFGLSEVRGGFVEFGGHLVVVGEVGVMRGFLSERPTLRQNTREMRRTPENLRALASSLVELLA